MIRRRIYPPRALRCITTNTYQLLVELSIIFAMASEKLDQNLVVRVSKSMKLQLEMLAQAYETDPAEVLRRVLRQHLDEWTIPGFKKLSKPK